MWTSILIVITVEQYYKLWKSYADSPHKTLVLSILDHAPACESPTPVPAREHLPSTVPPEKILAHLLKRIAENVQRLPEQLSVPSGNWDPLSPADLLTCLTSSMDDQPAELVGAFDVHLNCDEFSGTGVDRSAPYQDREPFEPSAFNGAGVLGHVAPAGYARFLDPINNAGAFVFVTMYSGAAVFLTWPRSADNWRHFIKHMVHQKEDDLTTTNGRKFTLKASHTTKMTDCRSYYVNGQSSFCFGADLFVAVVALEPIVFLTTPLYTVRSKESFHAIRSTGHMLNKMNGSRKETTRRALKFIWQAMMDSDEEGQPNEELTSKLKALTDHLRELGVEGLWVRGW